MRILTPIGFLVLTTSLCACDQQHSVSAVDPRLGQECYEIHRTSLPPGNQYEGIDKIAENVIRIRIMNGVDVVTLECALDQEGNLQSAGK